MDSKIFGPVPSRRLGFSLGVDIVPFKTCTLDCVYCQLGPTTNKTLERKKYVPREEVLAELKSVIEKSGRIDWITFSGSGEPTLHSGIGKMIRKIKEITDIPVAVLTNGTLLSDPALREELSAADLVIPSIDAGSEEAFIKANRPHDDLSLQKVMEGIQKFASTFSGRIWLEVMLVRGLNDGEAELKKIGAIIKRIKPERVQLNTVVRPPAEADTRALSREEMLKTQSFLQEQVGSIPVELITEFRAKRAEVLRADTREAIINYLRRRPATLKDLSAALGLNRNELIKYLDNLVEEDKIREQYSGSEKYHVFIG